MSHELTQHSDGSVEFAYLQAHGEPWHGLGQPMQAGQSIEEWRKAAGMDWRIRKAFVRYPTAPDGPMLTLDDHVVLHRSDNHRALGIVSAKYHVVQPAEMLEFFRDIARVGGLELSAAGTIFDGKRFWATARIGEASPLSVADKVGGYILLSSSADGSSATEARRTSIRTVCQNTLAMARSECAPMVKISHRSEFDADKVKRFMGLNTAAWDSFRHQIVRLANVSVQQDKAENLTALLLGKGNEDKGREMRGYDKILGLFNGAGMGANLEGVRGTAWGWLNAVTEYADHHVRATSEQNRMASAQWGLGATFKADAVALLA
jgi:phage/plasmid-like protein (TIGR03299 family)